VPKDISAIASAVARNLGQNREDAVLSSLFSKKDAGMRLPTILCSLEALLVFKR